MRLFRADSGNGYSAFIASVLLGSLFASQPAAAQDCSMTTIVQDNKDLDERYIDNINCAAARLESVETRLRKLESDLSVFRDATGLIAAFDRDKTRPCPSGWRLFEPAGGRFIVGAGDNSFKDVNGIDLTDHSVGVVGGEEKHKLTGAEIPNHSHSVYQHAGYHWPDIPNEQKTQPNQGAHGGDTTTFVHGGTTGTWGGDLPHNTMPPFVALYYCIKE